ncbi:MAG: aminotransferase class I/II-fold pyridoxal phosphate-dependent enzyme, partial [Planctomycetota bacterium]
DNAPDFRLDVEKLEAAITPKTKMIVVNSPANPTGVVATQQQLRDVADLARRHNLVLVSDEIYSQFQFDEDFVSPAQFNEQTVVIDGFSKSHAMTGWRVGIVHGPSEIVDTMIKLQQYTFVCSPQPAQWAALTAIDVGMESHLADYRRKRDFMVDALSPYYDIATPGGAFYIYPAAPASFGNSGTKLVHAAIEKNLLIIPGNIFSAADSHFRISYAADDEMLRRGVDVLIDLAKGGA